LYSTSPVKSLSLKNTGNAALTITTIEIAGYYPNQYKQTNNCGTSLAAGAACTVNVEFAPINLGFITALVTLYDNAGGSPQSVGLSGTGITSPLVSLSPTSLAFSNQATGTTSSAQSLSLRNSGSATLLITAIAITGNYANQFKQTNNCRTSLNPWNTCTVTVEFVPTIVGSITATVTFNDNAAGGSPQSVALSGTGTSGSASPSETSGVSLSPTSLSFGDEPIDIASSSQTITVKNTGGAALTISSIALSGSDPTDFTENNNCGTSLAAGGSCTVVISFTPSASGSLAASLSITDNASGSPQTAALSGTGTHDVVVSWSPSSASGVEGYNVYRGTTSGGESTTPLNSTPFTGTTYYDESVQAGQTYYYKVATVSSSGTQSADSSETSASVP
jgi:hypothetical protein